MCVDNIPLCASCVFYEVQFLKIGLRYRARRSFFSRRRTEREGGEGGREGGRERERERERERVNRWLFY